MKRVALILTLIIAITSCEKTISDFQIDNFIKYLGGGTGSYGFDAIELSDGGYIITGFDNSLQFRRQIMVVRTDKAGNLKWKRNFGTEHNEEGRVVKLVNSEVIIAGTKTNFITGANEGFLLWVNLNGDSLSYHQYATSGNIVLHSMDISGSNIYIAGEVYTSNATIADYYIACVDLTGAIKWQRIYGNTSGRQAYKRIFFRENGNILLVGSNNALIGSELVNITVVELNPEGLPIGGTHLISNKNQSIGDVVFQNNILYVLYSTQNDGLSNSHLAAIAENSTIDWDVDLGTIGTGTSLVMIGNDKVVITVDRNEVVEFNTVSFSPSGDNVTTNELRSFPGEVSRTIRTSDKGILSIGATSPDYGRMLRLIKTDEDLYLLKP